MDIMQFDSFSMSVSIASMFKEVILLAMKLEKELVSVDLVTLRSR